MLDQGAILIFIHEQTVVGRLQHVVQMPSTHERRGCLANRRIVRAWADKLKDRRIVPAAFWKGRYQTHREAIDRCQPIVRWRHASALKPRAQRGDARVSMRQHQDWLLAIMPRQSVGNQLRLPASRGSNDRAALYIQEIDFRIGHS
jgi:hypothetical protein